MAILQSAPSPDRGKEPAKLDKAMKKKPDKTVDQPKRKGRPPKEAQAKAPADRKKSPPGKRACGQEENFQLEGTGEQDCRGQGEALEGRRSEKAADNGSAVVKPPAPEAEFRAGMEQGIITTDYLEYSSNGVSVCSTIAPHR